MRELEKMRDYLGKSSHTVTEGDIAEISSQGVGVEPEIWAVTDAIGARKADAALDALSRFEGENGFAVMMTNAIERFFRQMVELKDAQEKGAFEQATEGMAPFAARKMAGFLRNWSLRELRVARYRFVTLREKVVSSSGSADVLVVTELLRVLRRT
jgi:DNA polymerase III delta subunit